MKHLGYSNYEWPPLVREPEDRKLMRNKHLWVNRAAVDVHAETSFVSQMSLEAPTFHEEWSQHFEFISDWRQLASAINTTERGVTGMGCGGCSWGWVDKGGFYEKLTFNDKRKPCLGRHEEESCMCRREGPTEYPIVDLRWGIWWERMGCCGHSFSAHNEPCFVLENPGIKFLVQSIHWVGLEGKIFSLALN